MSQQLKTSQAGAKQPMSAALLWTMAIACGISVANLYYSQPLLADIGRTFETGANQVGVVSMLTQVGYALGMLFFIPLGDIRERRRLIVGLSTAVSLALVGVALAQNIVWLALASLVVGITTVVPQVIVPFAADLAVAQERGKVVGSVMSGLLVGILLARTVSGFIGNWFGWRAMYWLAAILMLLLAICLRMLLPKNEPNIALPYRELMQSVWTVAKQQPMLWEASLMGGALFGAFSVFWTTLAFFLEYPPYHFGSNIVGLFGLVGVVGASVAPFSGRMADRWGARSVAGIATVITLIAYLVLWSSGQRLWGLVLGVILLDAGIQGAQISNQATIFSLVPEASNRINTVYMVSYFIGGALGSSLGAAAWSAGKWSGVCILGIGMTVLALITWLMGRTSRRQAWRTV
ncbi:MAG TPA: MFS transporter [Desulfobacteria bacterium]|nr:MFS transporter [Desulfobacteria bacterium]